MNQDIEDNLVLGLTRIFSAYGWSGEGAPQHLSQKVSYISWGLHHGDAIAYKTHLKMLINAREKTGDWSPFTSIFVYGMLSLLENYAEFNDLYDIKTTTPRPELPSRRRVGNVFTETSVGRDVIKRIHRNDKTVLRYSFVEEYGLDKLRKDLRKVFPKGKIYICTDDHVPDQIRDWLWDEGVRKMTVFYPIMPLVIVTNGIIN